MDVKGGCLCGSVEFTVSDIGRNIYQCHCSLCRKQGGSASNSGTVVPLEKLEWTKGREHVTAWRKETGFSSSFCSHCGSPVPNQLGGSDFYWIPVGTLEDAPFQIVANLYIDSKASWGVVAPTGERFETMPELDNFIALLSENGHGKGDAA
jgi:hypothetical protein